MFMRIVWGKVLPGQWEAYEAAFKQALAHRGPVQGLNRQWLVRDQQDRDAGYSISLWVSEADMQAYWRSDKREKAMVPIRKFYANQYTVTQCEVRYESGEMSDVDWMPPAGDQWRFD